MLTPQDVRAVQFEKNLRGYRTEDVDRFLDKVEQQLEQDAGQMEALRKQVESNSDYVGMSFAAEARAMHEGSAPERAIHGEARLEDAKKLLEDGSPVAPLPFRPRQRVN